MSNDHPESRHSRLFDSAPEALIVVDDTGEVVRSNARVEELFGYEPTVVEGEPVEQLLPTEADGVHPIQRALYLEQLESRLENDDLELCGRHRDGTTFPVSVRLNVVQTGDGVEGVAAVRNDSARTTPAGAFEILMELSPDAVAIVDPESEELLEVNQQLAELVGLSESELVGRDQTCLHPSEDEARYRDLFRRHVRSGTVSTENFPDGDGVYVETAEGEVLQVEIRGKVKRVEGRKAFVGIFRDVSDRTSHEQDLRRKVASLERLARVLSHDLRTPLTVAKSGVDDAKRTDDLEELEQVETAHARIENSLNDALTIVREGYEVESVDSLEFEAIASACWENVSNKDASLRVVTDGTLYADLKRVRNLFENLFLNAIEHGGEDVLVRAGVYKDGFFVADDGTGTPDDEREHVTEPGWTTAADGAGLGVNIVSEIALAHDWKLAVGESRTGGARFDFTGVRTSVESGSSAS